MESLGKIVTPTIQRFKSDSKNDLYDLINVIPAEYKVALDLTKNNDCDFIPRTGKYYIPKKQSKHKVKTVRDIRKVFEEDTYSYLSNELERQQSVLLRKIRCGSACSEDTKTLAKKILKSDTPISRSAWQMLVNINPDLQVHPKQYVIWNDKYIQVNGSKGGKDKFLFKYNLAYNKINIHKKSLHKKSMIKTKGLLRNSLVIKFKPGPLRRKKILDISHQKYHVGDIELINLPKPGLDIMPTVGTPLEPTITSFLNNLRNDDGIISQKWAELAVSVLSTIKKTGFSETSKEYISFDLGYKFDQHRILMRRDVESFKCSKKDDEISQQIDFEKNESLILPEVEDIMSKILDTVEISINQDNMFTTEDEIIDMDDVKQESLLTKDTKAKRKFCELGRLDVTVIRLPRESQNTYKENCNKLFCTLGCICDSLAGTVKFKRHCGRLDCMFKCKCDFSKYSNIHAGVMDYDLLPGLVHFDTELNLKLSKEEQKFHQTVIVTDEKSILLKAQKRNSKVPKKYAEFYDHASLKQKGPCVKPLSIVAVKIDCQYVEPWCMVHNLYRCFCKGIFTQSCKPTSNECVEDCVVTKKPPNFENNEPTPYPSDLSTCSRVNMYLGRKFNDVYYKETNDKIRRMEENDDTLSNKLEIIVNKTDAEYAATEHKSDKMCLDSEEIVCNDEPFGSTITPITKDTNKIKTYSRKIVPVRAPIYDAKPKGTKDIENSANINQILTGIDEVLTQTKDSGVNLRSKGRRLPNKTKLVAWLETNYKMFKERIDRGLNKIYLEPPKVGKVALYPWHFILDRYRERKNLFLISKSKPYRIFMAVHSNIPTLENCVNINDIRFAELHNYPVTIKNLLTNATELKDNFCILCGLTGCWEVIGSVTKVNEAESASLDPTPSNIENSNCFDLNTTWDDRPEFEDDIKYSVQRNTSETAKSKDIPKSPEVVVDDSSPILIRVSDHGLEDCNMSNETSKWFVMTVENDFSEIRFYKKGFFVKYESIVKAINVARISAKSVRLSSQKCVDKSNGPQFGIYAIPNANEYCVFVGPYDIEESLGIETIKTIMDVRKAKRTRGFWITTSKVDNMRVIDNPLSFMPFNTLDTKETVTLDNGFCSSNEQDNFNKSKMKDNEKVVVNNTIAKNTNKTQKTVKPIKIRKTNGFYHLSSNGLLKKITSPNASPSANVVKSLLLDKNKTTVVKVSENMKQDATQELSPIKITSVYSVKDGSSDINVNVSEKGMFILKPEEINKKLFGDESSPEKKSLHSEFKVLSNLKNALRSQKNRTEIHAETSVSKKESLLKKRSSNPVSIIDTNKNLKGQNITQTSFAEVCIISDEEDEDEDEEKRCQKRRRLWMDSFKSDLIAKEENRNSTNSPNKGLVALSPSTQAGKSKKENNPEETSLAKNPDSSSSSLPETQLPWNQADAQSSNILASLANAPDKVKRSMTEALSNIMSLVKDLDDD